MLGLSGRAAGEIEIIRSRKDNERLLSLLQSDPDLVTPDLVTPRFNDRINFPRYRKLTVFDPDVLGLSGRAAGEIEIIRSRKDNERLLSLLQSDPDLVTPDLVTPRFNDRINFPRYRKLTVFDPDVVPTPI
eukprot:sb/3475039/